MLFIYQKVCYNGDKGEEKTMDIRVLKYFLAIAQEENVTKAAELLHTTQPNISRQIAELEEELGKQLFVKNGRRFVLTEEGVFLRKRAKRKSWS